MEESERIPADLLEAAKAIVASGGQITLPYDAGDASIEFDSRRRLCGLIARALLAERERCARVAENFDAWPQEGADIAAAIRG